MHCQAGFLLVVLSAAKMYGNSTLLLQILILLLLQHLLLLLLLMLIMLMLLLLLMTMLLCLLHRPYKYLLLHYIVFTQVRSAGQLLGVAPPWRHVMLNGATMAPP